VSVTQYAFFVNSDACSGCKTCQVACKDRHDVRAGVHWRRVYEVTAGSWAQKDGAWTSTVAAYHLSMACLHCQTPVCARPCSTDAIWKRPDGIVLIDDSRCTKCRKCENDCPYGAIRWDGDANAVRKCTFCVEDLEAGLPPACVAACPNRALEYGEFEDLKRKYGTESRVFPMPDPALTGPAIVIRPHRHAAQVQSRNPEVSNWEEL
jgi:anaerobic dimethyl sulfoxide reductase subunit B (iron-sulfur subunit)